MKQAGKKRRLEEKRINDSRRGPRIPHMRTVQDGRKKNLSRARLKESTHQQIRSL